MGAARRAASIARFRALLAAQGVRVEVSWTTGPHDATRFAAQALRSGVREIVVAGGDGTINEALQGFVGAARDAAGARLGLWPAGTANVLAHELGLPFGVEAVARMIARGATRRVHLGCAMNETTGARRYFFLMAGVGLDASVVHHVRPALKRRFGELAYWYAGFEHLTRWPPAPFTLEVEGEAIPATFAIIGKGARYGGGLGITPRARLDAPEFEICVINSRSRLRYFALLAHSLRRGGVRQQTPGVRFLRAASVHAYSHDDDGGPVRVQVDGELIGQLPLRFEIASDSVQLIAPRVGYSERLR